MTKHTMLTTESCTPRQCIIAHWYIWGADNIAGMAKPSQHLCYKYFLEADLAHALQVIHKTTVRVPIATDKLHCQHSCLGLQWAALIHQSIKHFFFFNVELQEDMQKRVPSANTPKFNASIRSIYSKFYLAEGGNHRPNRTPPMCSTQATRLHLLHLLLSTGAEATTICCS